MTIRSPLRGLISALLAASGAWLSSLAAADIPLERLRLPEGFSVALFAKVENARQMTRSDTGVIYVGSRRAGKVHAVIDRDGDYRADEVLLIAEDLTLPSGVTWHDGDLYVGAVSTIYRFPNIDEGLQDTPAPRSSPTPCPQRVTTAGNT
jgi:glucose/arabinose dehydrogenase